MHSYMHVFIHSYMHTYTHICTHIQYNTCMHTHIHDVCIQTYIHGYISLSVLPFGSLLIALVVDCSGLRLFRQLPLRWHRICLIRELEFLGTDSQFLNHLYQNLDSSKPKSTVSRPLRGEIWKEGRGKI